MDFIKSLLKELNEEAVTTRKMLSAIPEDKYGWQPHPKSMTIQHLANHIAELPFWVAMALTTDELDFAANPYTSTDATKNTDVLALYEKSLAAAIAELEKSDIAVMDEPWILRHGEHIIRSYTRAETIRMALCQQVHHRAQLGVFLRLLNTPIPGSYGPSADEN